MNNEYIEEVFVDDDEFDIQANYVKFNKKYFNNKLPKKAILRTAADYKQYDKDQRSVNNAITKNVMILIIGNAGIGYAGICHTAINPEDRHWRPYMISLKKGWDYKSVQDMEAVLLHEMCHASVSVEYGTDTYSFLRIRKVKKGHGPEWEAEMRRVEKLYGHPLGGRYVNTEVAKFRDTQAVKQLKKDRLAGVEDPDDLFTSSHGMNKSLYIMDIISNRGNHQYNFITKQYYDKYYNRMLLLEDAPMVEKIEIYETFDDRALNYQKTNKFPPRGSYTESQIKDILESELTTKLPDFE